MVKHTHTIRRQKPTNCLSLFDHFVELALKGLIPLWKCFPQTNFELPSSFCKLSHLQHLFCHQLDNFHNSIILLFPLVCFIMKYMSCCLQWYIPAKSFPGVWSNGLVSTNLMLFRKYKINRTKRSCSTRITLTKMHNENFN